MTAITLVIGSDYPYFQIQAMLIFSLMTLIYIGSNAPYGSLKTNLNESFNEICILICVYLVMAFMMTTSYKNHLNGTYIFIGTNLFNVTIFALQFIVGSILKIINKRVKDKAKNDRMRIIGNQI